MNGTSGSPRAMLTLERAVGHIGAGGEDDLRATGAFAAGRDRVEVLLLPCTPLRPSPFDLVVHHLPLLSSSSISEVFPDLPIATTWGNLAKALTPSWSRLHHKS